MSSGDKCRECGAVIPPDSPGGYCAQCLLRLGLETAAEPPDASSAGQAAAPLTPLAGTKLRYFGDYELLEEIARGGMGIVFKARQLSLNRLVALKLISAGALATPDLVKRFKAEAEAAASLTHPNIVPIYEIGEHQGQHYFSMGLIEGPNLREALARSRRGNDADDNTAVESGDARRRGPPPYVGGYGASKAARLISTIARAVHYAHQRGVLHRDLKPSNILLDAQGEPHLTDFGLAKLIEKESTLTHTHALLGTPAYMSPEQARGDTPVTTAADVYGLGAVLYETLTGSPPFAGGTSMETIRQVLDQEPRRPSIFNPAVDRDLETICLKCLEKEPSRRYGSAEALSDDFDRWLRQEPIVARPSNAWERTIKWTRRNPAKAGLAVASGVAVLALVGIGVGYQYQSRLQTAYRASEQSRQAEALARNAEAEQRKLAESALTKSEAYHYFNRISYAEREWSANNVARAEGLLDECPEALRHWEWFYLKRLCNAELWKFPAAVAPNRPVNNLSFTPDGQQLFAAQAEGSLLRWDLSEGEHLNTLRAPTNQMTDFALSPDGTRLAVATLAQSTVSVLDAATGRSLWSRAGNADGSTLLAWSNQGDQVVAVGRSGLVRILSARDGGLLQTVTNGFGPVHCVTLSRDGRSLALSKGDTLLSDGVVAVWDLPTSKALFSKEEPKTPIYGLAFSPDGQTLVTGHADGTIRLWPVGQGEVRLTIRGHVGPVLSVAFSPDGSLLVTSGSDQTIQIWTWAPRSAYWEPRSLTAVRLYRSHTAPVHKAILSPDNKRLASISEDNTIRIWDATNEPGYRSLGGPPKDQQLDPQCGVTPSVAFSPDRTHVAVIQDGIASVWNALTRTKVFVVPGYPTRKAAFSPDGKRLAVSQRRCITIMDASTGQLLATLAGHQEPVYGVAFSPDGKQIASCSRSQFSGEIKLWETASTTETRSLRGPEQRVFEVAFSPDGKYLAAIGGEWAKQDFNGPSLTSPSVGEQPGEVTIWDLASAQPLHSLRGFNSYVWGLAFSPDSKTLATVGGRFRFWNWSGSIADRPDGGEVKLWDVATGHEIAALAAKQIGLLSVAFTPDGRRLIAGGGDLVLKRSGIPPAGQIRLWDPVTRQEISSLRMHAGPIYDVAVTDDGKLLASATADGTVGIWTMHTTERK